jgi:predicted secreted protein
MIKQQLVVSVEWGMNWFLAIVIFITSWFILLFILLPIGLVREDNPVPGQPLSAPKKVGWGWKLAVNTVLSLVVTAGLLVLFSVTAEASESPLNKPAAPGGGGVSTNSAIVYPQPAPGRPSTVHVLPCQDRVPHIARPDVHYQPNVDAHGKPVVSADLGRPAPAMADLENPIIPLYAPLTGQPIAPIPGQPTPEAPEGYNPQTYAHFGNIEIVGGQALLNGQPMTPPDACPN